MGRAEELEQAKEVAPRVEASSDSNSEYNVDEVFNHEDDEEGDAENHQMQEEVNQESDVHEQVAK